MKVVELKVLGSEREPLDLELWPGITSDELLAKADLAGYVLSRKGDQKYLQPEEDLYNLLTDCETLYASTPACEVY
jgi:hypothetical protein